MADTQPVARSRLRLFLGLSIALNLFVIGAAVGASAMYWRAHSERRDTQAAHVEGDTLWLLSEKLSPAHRDALQTYLRNRGDQLADQIHAVRTARRKAGEAIIAPSFDGGAVQKELSETRAGEFAVRSELDRSLISFMTSLSPEERRILAPAVVNGRIGRPAAAPVQEAPVPDNVR